MSFPTPRPRGKDMPSAKPLRKTTNTSSNSAFGYVGARPPAHAPHFNDAEFSAQQALDDSRRIRTKRAGQSVFDKSTGGAK